MAEARKALGGDDRLAAVKTLDVRGDFKRATGQNTVEGELQIRVERPDKLRRDPKVDTAPTLKALEMGQVEELLIAAKPDALAGGDGSREEVARAGFDVASKCGVLDIGQVDEYVAIRPVEASLERLRPDLDGEQAGGDVVLVRRKQRMGKGTTKHRTNMAQKSGAKGPENFAMSTAISTGSCPYQVVRCSAKVK